MLKGTDYRMKIEVYEVRIIERKLGKMCQARRKPRRGQGRGGPHLTGWRGVFRDRLKGCPWISCI